MTLEKDPNDPLSCREGCGDKARHDPNSSEIVVRNLANDTIVRSFPHEQWKNCLACFPQ